jgi:hypothetical protein
MIDDRVGGRGTGRFKVRTVQEAYQYVPIAEIPRYVWPAARAALIIPTTQPVNPIQEAETDLLSKT